MENNNSIETEKRYWLYQPGEKARLWDDVYSNSVMAIGWDELGDLSVFKNSDQILTALKEIYNKPDSNPTNDKCACDDFVNQVQIGDVVLVKNGLYELIGRGIVEGKYTFDDSRSEYKNIRTIKWTHRGIWSLTKSFMEKHQVKQLPQKTLTDISVSKYKDFALDMEKIIVNNMNENKKNYVDLLLNNHNIILHGAPGTGKTYLAKEIAKSLNNSELNLTVQGFESFISAPGYLVKYDSSKDKETGTIQRYEKVAAKLLEKYNSFEYIADNAETLRDEMQAERDEAGKPGWDNNQIVVNHIKKYVEFARKENHVNSDDTIGFCQFHPSYDYTDFVEGLRPTKNNGFERKDGVFKEFCANAVENLIDYNNEVSAEKNKAINTQDLINQYGLYIERKLMESEEKLIPFSNSMKIRNVLRSSNGDVRSIVIASSLEAETKQNLTAQVFNRDYQAFKDGLIKSYQDIKPLKESSSAFHGNADYLFVLYGLVNQFENSDEYMKDSKNINNKNTAPKNYVFIIDEINRGELSKIFGELFFSIDPGYRGLDERGNPKGLVKTQYQNLVDDDDVFADGFYIPENVYIIGTMNDIDRSVESMDFAMRRRFTFVEVTAEESADNMNITGEALQKMNAINKVISKMPELGKSYCIGSAYFKDAKDLQKLWDLKISSLVFEYLRGIDNYTEEHKDGEKFDLIKSAYDNPDSVA